MADRSELLNDAEQALRLALDGRQSTIWTAIPGIVQAVNFTEMTCSVQPAIQGVVFNERGDSNYVNLPLLVDVPIVFPSAGGFLITLPLKAGDEVLVVFSSRCMDSWWSNSGIGVPMEMRMHDLSDGFALPGPRSKPKVVSGISSTGAQIRNDAGTTYIEISANGKIKLVSPSEIDITGDLKVSGAVTAQGEVTGNGVALSTHVHSGVTPGGGTSGPPL